MIKNEVIILGTIHSQHLQDDTYSLQELNAILHNLNPHILLVELPISHFDDIFSEFKAEGKIVKNDTPHYPEYPLVILPYAIKKGIEVVPFSAWSKKMVVDRDNKLEEIKNNPKRKQDWNTFLEASELSYKMFRQENETLDPMWIHSDRFDELMEIRLSVFNRLFNAELKEGGWDNINNAHYQSIDKTLTNNEGKGLRILIMIGAGHKGWMKRKLRERQDIELKNLVDVL